MTQKGIWQRIATVAVVPLFSKPVQDVQSIAVILRTGYHQRYGCGRRFGYLFEAEELIILHRELDRFDWKKCAQHIKKGFEVTVDNVLS